MIAFDCTLARPRFLLDVAFTSQRGCVALFGPSGCGKTTVARLIAGLDRPDRGRVVVGEDVLVDTAAKVRVPVHKRRVGLVFQDGQLLPHLTVGQNLAYGRYFAPAEQPAIAIDAVLGLLGIGHLLERRPTTLSGGERQRVAIGRALLARPRILVMDEPLASLDTERKLEILPFIERLRDDLRIPIVYVSHAVEEVARLAETVVRLADGKVVAVGPPEEVLAPSLQNPGSDRFEAVSILSGSIARTLPEFAITVVAHPAGDIALPGLAGPVGRPVRIAVRATNVTIATGPPHGLSVRTALKGRVIRIEMGAGPLALLTIGLEGGDRISAFATRLAVNDLGLAHGSTVFALLKAVSIDERQLGGPTPGAAD
jgi:molybdate transport system ATP-binding protein